MDITEHLCPSCQHDLRGQGVALWCDNCGASVEDTPPVAVAVEAEVRVSGKARVYPIHILNAEEIKRMFEAAGASQRGERQAVASCRNRGLLSVL